MIKIFTFARVAFSFVVEDIWIPSHSPARLENDHKNHDHHHHHDHHHDHHHCLGEFLDDFFLSNLERLLSESEPASEVCSHGLEMKLLELSSLWELSEKAIQIMMMQTILVKNDNGQDQGDRMKGKWAQIGRFWYWCWNHVKEETWLEKARENNIELVRWRWWWSWGWWWWW